MTADYKVLCILNIFIFKVLNTLSMATVISLLQKCLFYIDWNCSILFLTPPELEIVILKYIYNQIALMPICASLKNEWLIS